MPGQWYVFSCGCSGILPAKRQPNALATWDRDRHFCRVTKILGTSLGSAKKHGYKPIDPTTPHSVVRAMQENNCVLCRQPIDWSAFGPGITPHLHHDHVTGEIYGFAHMKCNLFALQRRVRELEAKIVQLEKESQPVLKRAA